MWSSGTIPAPALAGLLNLSLYTVETHRRNLQDKLNLHSFAELILYALRKGVIA
jgi:two-component system, NarL family, response regulator NreC